MFKKNIYIARHRGQMPGRILKAPGNVVFITHLHMDSVLVLYPGTVDLHTIYLDLVGLDFHHDSRSLYFYPWSIIIFSPIITFSSAICSVNIILLQA